MITEYFKEIVYFIIEIISSITYIYSDLCGSSWDPWCLVSMSLCSGLLWTTQSMETPVLVWTNHPLFMDPGTRYRPSGLNRARCGTWCWTWSAEKTWCQTSRPSCPPAPSWRPYPGTSQSECLEQQSLMLSSFQNNYKYKNILKLNWSSYSVVHLLVRHTCHTPTSVENIWQLLGQKCPKKGITSTHFIF